ncbi:hypothetical protein P691DRAFT_462732 [Macrolepiota fuliginosa MF-IS2]|uniref:Ribonucleases P/MRP subunit Pop8-like domain-containing protein n=1 Tax=Macrolepiota fuliginosa MF-IS2 TaxID=1400762 RepID=A0A9P6C3V2_9AGAR|nr:hypothetical protein P691DRAFT_462732 [Macrolepiota fuliginosa MF-IS2]
MYHYIRLKVSPPSSDALAIRKTIADALSQAFGLTAEGAHVDILFITHDRAECVLRVRSHDAPRLLTSLVSWSEHIRFSLIKETSFLPSLLNEPII